MKKKTKKDALRTALYLSLVGTQPQVHARSLDLQMPPWVRCFSDRLISECNRRWRLLSGILTSEDDREEDGSGSGEESDEILAELKKKQAELRALSHQNAIMLRHLHRQAKEELQRQELKKRMAAADAEVNNALMLTFA